jgi:hypothetical protein
MSDERDAKGLERFEEDYRRWGRRPAAIQAGAAATRIRARIAARRRRRRTAAGLAWASVFLLAVAGNWLIESRRGAVPSPSPQAVHAPVALPDNVVLWWLDPETPVYFVIRPAEPGEGGR